MNAAVNVYRYTVPNICTFSIYIYSMLPQPPIPLALRERTVVAIPQSEPSSPNARKECVTTRENIQVAPKTQNRDDNIFYIGKKFHSINEVDEAKAKYEAVYFCELWKRDVRTLASAQKRVPKRIANADLSLRYYSMKLTCKFGGRTMPKRGDRKRDTKTFKQGCPFEIYLVLSSDGKALEVAKMTSDHSHSISKELYDHLPRQRKLTGSLREEVKNAVRLKANNKLLQQKIQTSTGLPVTLKDISNLKTESKLETNSNDVEVVVNYLKAKEGAVVEVAVDKDNNFKSLFFQDQYMKNAYEKFPEMLLVDATYKLLDLRMPLYVLMVVDGNGLSDIVGLLIVAEESEAVITSAMESFKQHNTAWVKTSVIMSDKDFNERQAFAKCFPGASLLICLYHTLRTFRREITVEKMGITSDERDRALEMITKIVYSKSEEAYEANVEELKAAKWKAVADYFLDNWHPIKEQWVACFKDLVFNLGETTNNRLESTNAKIKSVCSRYGSMLQFFTEMSAVLGALRNERHHQQIMGASRQSTGIEAYEKDIRKYAEVLTPYAFKHVRNQAKLADCINVQQILPESKVVIKSSTYGQVTVTADKCQCSYPVKMGLPCRHILKARTALNLSRFDQSLCSTRWTMDYYKKAFKGVTPTSNSGSTNVDVIAAKEQKQATLTQAQKFRKAMDMARTLATHASEGGMKTFQHRIADMQQLLDKWQMQNNSGKNNPDSHSCTRSVTNLKTSKIKDKKPEIKKKLENNDARCESQESPRSQTVADTNNKTTGPHRMVEKKSSQLSSANDHHKKLQGKDGNANLKDIKMPPKMLKRGRPKGADSTVIGLPKAKKIKKGLLPFSRVRGDEKNRIILECFVRPLIAKKAIENGKLISSDEVESNIHNIPDMVRDKENVDIYRIEKFFSRDAWLIVLATCEEKNKSKWTCPGCTSSLKRGDESVACERCLQWYHMKCTSLNGLPKVKNWFCRKCKSKYL